MCLIEYMDSKFANKLVLLIREIYLTAHITKHADSLFTQLILQNICHVFQITPACDHFQLGFSYDWAST